MSTSKRIASNLQRDLFVLQDESNPRSTQVDTIWPTTVLDQVFDNQSPTNKTLREIIEDLKVEIITGGRGNIIFPVTSVNGKTDDVVLTKVDIGLGRVDNTRDIDKPLSTPQRTAVEEMLSTYDFKVNLDDLYNHLKNTNNPHGITIDQINNDGALERFVTNCVSKHNLSREHSVHTDIRNSLSRLWILVEGIDKGLEDRVSTVLDSMKVHTEDILAHQSLFEKKEDVEHKVSFFNATSNSDHTKYPTTKAVVEFVANRLESYRQEFPDIKDWINNIIVIDYRSDLPAANARHLRDAYFIRNGNGSHTEIAICRHDPDFKTYSWDISTLGSYSKFNPEHFVDTADGVSIKMTAVIDAIISKNGMLDTSLSEILSGYYTKDDVKDMHLINKISMQPGTVDGTIRFYINDDLTTMSDDIKVAGLHRLAYLEWITEDEIKDQSIFGRHIISKAIEGRHLQDHIIDADKMNCRYGYLIGNVLNPDSQEAHEIPLLKLADDLRPLIGGWPDPNTPGGNPWSDMFNERIMHPHLWKSEEEHPLEDYSYAMRFTGTISAIPNMPTKTILTTKIKLGECRLTEAGGAWQYQTDPDEWTILGGSNITGHTFATVVMTKEGIQLESISIGDRMNAEYDIWVKYIKPHEINQLTHNEI